MEDFQINAHLFKVLPKYLVLLKEIVKKIIHGLCVPIGICDFQNTYLMMNHKFNVLYSPFSFLSS